MFIIQAVKIMTGISFKHLADRNVKSNVIYFIHILYCMYIHINIHAVLFSAFHPFHFFSCFSFPALFPDASLLLLAFL